MLSEKKTENILLKKILTGNETAWKELVDKYSSLLLSIARRTFSSYGYPASSHDVEDAIANVWINLLENGCKIIKKCIKRGNFIQTLTVLARNRAIDIMRKNKSSNVEFQEHHAEIFHPITNPPSLEIDDKTLKEALMQLHGREKIIIPLFFLQKLKYKEISALTGIPQNSIGPTIKRALERLYSILKKSLNSNT